MEEEMELITPKRGRPVGTTEDPSVMMKKDLQQTLKLQKRIRDTVENQVNEIENKLVGVTDLKSRLDAVEILARAMEVLTKTIQQTAGFITKTKESPREEDFNLDDILKLMEGEKHTNV